MNIKRVILIFLAILTTFSLSACESNVPKNQIITETIENVKEYNENIEDDDSLEKENNNIKINIQVGINNFTAVLYNEVASQEFLELMPMTLSMRELNGNEKLCYMEEGLTTNSKYVGFIDNGDLMLYGSDCLVLFYKSFPTQYSYTKIGYIENPLGLAEAVGRGSVEITFSKNNLEK